MTDTITVAQLSDVHLGPIAGFTPRYWNLKRALGYANWLRNRRAAHQRSVLDRVLADVKAQSPDHIAVTGDLVNIGLPQEHIDALTWLEGVGPPERVSVIPGNHDIYSWLGADPGVARWVRYMASDEHGAAHAANEDGFPFVRMMGRVALIGVNSAVQTPPFVASGRVGPQQLESLAATLDRLGRADVFRLVLIHHPPLPGLARPRHDLEDSAVLEAVLASHGAELVVHGHNHVSTVAWCNSAAGKIPVVGAPSASLGRPHRREPLARYHLYRIAGGPPWTVELIGRGLGEVGGKIVELERRLLTAHARA